MCNFPLAFVIVYLFNVHHTATETTFDITYLQNVKKTVVIEYFTYLCIIGLIFSYFSRWRTRGIYIPTRNIFGQTLLQL